MAALSQVLAFDPGLKGALSWVDQAGNLIDVVDMPVVNGEVNAQIMRTLILEHGDVEAALVEKQQAYPKQGVSSSFKTGTGYGIIIGLLAGLQIPTFFWPASQWKKYMKLSRDKELSRQRALARWPFQTDLFKLKKHEGRAEAALFAASWFMSKERNQLLGTLPPPMPRRKLIRRYPDNHLATVDGLEHT
jgi:crossover junction endodeoxyribonuclease RuvC